MSANYTNLPEPNVALAKRDLIRLLCLTGNDLCAIPGHEDLTVRVRAFQYYQFVDEFIFNVYHPKLRADLIKDMRTGITKFVDAFMAKHPRGRGLHGSLLLRTAYNYCWVIKRESSRGRYQAYNVDGAARRHEQAKDSPIFRFDKYGCDLAGSQRGITDMVRAGEVDGYGKDVWLTEKGMKTREVALQYRARSERVARVAQHQTMGEKLRAYHLKMAVEATNEDDKALHTYAIEVINRYKPELS